MFIVEIMDCYADPYETFRGKGLHKRSVKRAVELAKADLAAQIRRGDQWAGSGTPILWEMRITFPNGRVLVTTDEHPHLPRLRRFMAA